jgi:hypothetical protein
MKLKVIQDYIKKCKSMRIEPTWNGLRNHKRFSS